MPQNGARFAGAMLLFLTLIEASMAQHAVAKVSVGTWGGRSLQMEVTQQGATLEFDCAQGTIPEPLVLDATGKFRAKGTFQTGGGPVRRDQKPGSDVVYTGTVEGDTMQLEFTLAEDKGSPFALHKQATSGLIPYRVVTKSQRQPRTRAHGSPARGSSCNLPTQLNRC